MTIKLVKNNKILLIRTVRIANTLGGAGDKIGWIRIASINVPGGSTANEVYQDAPNNTIIQSLDVSDGTFNVVVESSFPKVEVNGVPATLPPVGSIYTGAVSVTIVADGFVIAKTINPDDIDAAEDSVSVVLDTPPALLTLFFVGGYPGAQTELKSGDTYQLSGTTDKACDGIEVQDAGASDVAQLLVFGSNTSFTVTMVVGDRGVLLQALPATARARSATTGALGVARSTNELAGVVDGTDLVNLNNLAPSVAIGAIVYPATQGALKGAEAATVANVLADFDTVLYDSPGAELTVTLPAVSEDPKTVNRLAGSYNTTINNFRITANRAANDATTVDQAIVAIANVSPTLQVSEPAARLRSGGNDGTAVQNHTITITADQDLPAAPTLAPDGGGARGTFAGLFTGGPQVWTAALQIADTDEKGVFAWGSITGTGLSGILAAVITGDGAYTLGGFVARTLTWAAFQTNTVMNVEVVDFSKIQAGVFTATNQPSIRQPIATPPSVTDGYTIDSIGINPTDVIWLDTPAVASNATGTAQLENIEEVV